jgi:hypothetical protein
MKRGGDIFTLRPDKKALMELTRRETWTALHGMVFGAIFLLAFGAVFVELWSMRDEWVTEEGVRRGQRRMITGAWAMAIVAWVTVIVGTWVVYPWYRAKPPKDLPVAALGEYPKALLVSSPTTADWHEFGMEWKEHFGWFAPILATAVAFVVTRYRRRLARDPHVRRATLTLLTIAFCCATIAGLLGALIDKAAPIL